MNTSNHLEEEANYSPILLPLPPQTEEAAVQERVTAQEFTQALASLEAQREQSERVLHNTVPIGEALQQLGLTASAAEILTEVQAQRRRQAQEQQATLQRSHFQHKRRHLALALTSSVVLCMSFLLLTSLRQSPVPEIATPASIVVPQLAPAPATAELQTLAEVPEEQMTYCKPQDFKALLQNPALSPSQVIVQTSDTLSSMGKWTLVKHDGHIYVRGYMAAMSPQVMAQMKTLQMFSGGYDSSQTGGLAYVKPVTVRLGSFSWKGTGGEAGIPSITVSDLHLDPYANAHP